MFLDKLRELIPGIENKKYELSELPYNKENEATSLVIIITNASRTKYIVKERDDGSLGLPSGKGVLEDKRFGGNLRLAAIAEALHTMGMQDLEEILSWNEKNISLLKVFQSLVKKKPPQVIPLYEMILPDGLEIGYSNDHTTRKAEWKNVKDFANSDDKYAFEHSDLIKYWIDNIVKRRT